MLFFDLASALALALALGVRCCFGIVHEMQINFHVPAFVIIFHLRITSQIFFLLAFHFAIR